MAVSSSSTLQPTALTGNATLTQSMPVAELPKVDHFDRHGYLFGKKIAASLSPLLHGVVYSHLDGRNWGQVRFDSTDIPLFIHLAQRPSFYGASVTMPNKVAIIPYLDKLTPEAKAIGACNTLFIEDDAVTGRRLLCGANTDTVGVRDSFTQNLSSEKLENSVYGRPGLIIGGGGAARSAIYALRTWLRVTDIYLVNRDTAEVQYVISDLEKSGFGTDGLVHITSLEQAEALDAPGAMVGCVPDFPPQTPEECTARQISTYFFKKSDIGTFLDMCYNPSPYTELGAQAERHGCRVILGTEAMIYQGLEQDRYWTGHDLGRLPVEAVKKAVASHLRSLAK